MGLTIIQDLGRMLMHVPGAHVDFRDAEMLVTLQLGAGRQQVVKVFSLKTETGGRFVRLQSRAVAIKSHGTVRSALRENCGFGIGGLAMDTSVNPPMLDVILSLPVVDLNNDEFLSAIMSVAHYADSIEQRSGGPDQF